MTTRYRAYKVELKPNNKQKTSLLKSCGAARFAYNWAWNQCKEALDKKTTVPTFPALNKRLNAIKQGQFPWMQEVASYCALNAVRDLRNAFELFFSKKARFPKPRSKKKNGVGSFRIQFDLRRTFPQVTQTHIFIPRVGRVRLKQKGYIPVSKPESRLLSATVTEKAGRWYVSVNAEDHASRKPQDKDKDNASVVGVDLGINTFATLSDGQLFHAPRPLKANMRKLKRDYRAFTRKQKGSKNSRKAARRVGKLHARMARIRKDYLHKTTTKLAKTKRVIVVEDLCVNAMMKLSFVKAVIDLSFHEFRQLLAYKGRWYGCEIIVVDRFYPSSKTCSKCGFIKEALSLNERAFKCEACGFKCNRDLNAARNLENVAARPAETLTACGEDWLGRSSDRTMSPPSKKQAATTKRKRG